MQQRPAYADVREHEPMPQHTSRAPGLIGPVEQTPPPCPPSKSCTRMNSAVALQPHDSNEAPAGGAGIDLAGGQAPTPGPLSTYHVQQVPVIFDD